MREGVPATRLAVAADLSLPVDAVTETFSILAKRGAGKTYTASVLVEEMLEARLQVVVIDPMGAWYGLRSSADGKGAGYPIAILGGDHADVPLEEAAGVVVADLVVDERLSAILDLSAFSKSSRRRFVADFLERLFARNREAMHVVLEEADLFAPEGALRDAGDQRMLGAVYDLVRRGRGRGIGTTLVTQRSASISKEVLDQTEILIALRTTGPRDRAAIRGWIDVHGEDADRAEVLRSLPSLPTGTAWVWWPVEGLLQQARIRTRRTWDSSATPRPGQARQMPRTLADVDLAAITERMTATIERAKADDPLELRRQILTLQREVEQQRRVAERAAALAPEVRVERVEVPVLNGQVGELREIAMSLDRIAVSLSDASALLVATASGIVGAIDRVADAQRPVAPTAPAKAAAARARAEPTAESTKRADPGELRLGRAERAVLSALAQYPSGLSRGRLALIAGYSERTGHFSNVLGRLRTLGLIDRGEPIHITDAGLEFLGPFEPLPAPGPDLVAYWLGRIGKAERAMLEALVAAWPDELTRDELGERSGYSPQTGHFSNVLGRLRGLGLVDGLRASDDLMVGN